MSVILFLGILTAAPAVSSAVTQGIAETGRIANDLAETGYSIPDENGFANRLAQLREKYPSYGYSGVYYEDGHAMAWQCYGYACLMLNEIFGIKYYADGFVNRNDYTWGQLYAGDIVRIRGNTHSIFITKVTKDGYYFTDGNWDHANGVRWDAFYTTEEMMATFTYRVHVPGNTLKGTAEPKVGLYAETPKLRNIECTATGITVSWSKAKDAYAYRVFFKTDKKNHWKAVGVTKKNYYHYTGDLQYGQPYYFTVVALDCYKEIISKYRENGIGTVYLVAPPEMKSVKATVGKITVKWYGVQNVTNYRLYGKAKTGKKWIKVADVKGTSFTFTGGKARTEYLFTVRCLNSKKAIISGSSPKPLSTVFLTYATQLKPPAKVTASLTKTQGVVKVAWKSVKGAAKYQVYYRRANVDKKWKKLTVTKKNYCFQRNCANNTVYRYSVRCLDKKGKVISDCSQPAAAIRYFRYPAKLKAVKYNNNGYIKVAWSAVKNAPSYTLYYKTTLKGQWQRVKTAKPITGTSYYFGNCKNGVKYYFTVRVSTKKGTALSYYNPKGTSLIYTVKKTVTPTVKPTTAPTVKPTTAPTVAPTTPPTVAPTSPPTTPPTEPAQDPDLTEATSHCTDFATEAPTSSDQYDFG